MNMCKWTVFILGYHHFDKTTKLYRGLHENVSYSIPLLSDMIFSNVFSRTKKNLPNYDSMISNKRDINKLLL